MIRFTMQQALHMAGVYQEDSDFEQDLKFQNWIADRKYCILDQDDSVDSSDVEVIIIKETSWKKRITTR
jgi:hypothetical protein